MIQLRHILLLFLLFSFSAFLSAQNVSNVVVEQKGDRIYVTYTLDKEADIYLSTNIDGAYHFCRSVSGDVGTNVAAGRNTIVWEVLSDMDEFVGQATFQVHASQSSHTKQTIAAKQQKEANRAARLEGIYPLAGFDLSGGFYGIGGSVYWPWVTGRPSRVGSYISYVCGMKDWKGSDNMFHNICFGATCTISKHVALFAAPGLCIVPDEFESNVVFNYEGHEYRASDTMYSNTYKFAVEGGICFKLLIFTLSAKYAYPSYFGFGVGLDFGWMH